MKLKKCYVYAFGKIKDFTYDFSDGFNQINEKNGWGKTTLATFIKCIFYGIDNGKKGLKGSERKKYKPWRSLVKFGGYVVFSWKDKSYRIERYFGDKESDDSVKLIDETTGKEIPKNEDLGKRIFSIDEEGFLSSIYFSQKDLEGDVSNGLIEKFNSSYSKDNDRFDKAIERVDTAIKEYKIRGDKGKISDIKREIAEIEQQLDKSIRAEKSYIETEKLYVSASNDCIALKKRIDDASFELERAANANAALEKRRRLSEYSDRISRLKADLTAKRELIKNKPDLSLKEIEENYNVYKELRELKEKLAALNEILAAFERMNNVQPSTKTAPTFTIAAFLSVVLLISSSLLFIFGSTILGVATLILSLFVAAFCIFSFVNGKKKYNDKSYNEQYQLKKSEAETCEKYIDYKSRQLTDFLSCFDFPSDLDVDAEFMFLRSNINDIKRIEKSLDEEDAKYLALSREVGELKDITVAKDTAEIQAELSVLRERLAQAEHDRADYVSRLKLLDEYASIKGDIENSLAEAKASLKKAEEEYQILSYTKDFLIKANDDIIAKYRKPLEKSFKKYLQLIDKSNDYSGVIDVNLNLSIVDEGAANNTLYYSQGYRDLFEICKRFAFIDVLFTGEKPFIILDDPFCNLDEDKIKTALDFLNVLSDEYQIIYFICHDSRSV